MSAERPEEPPFIQVTDTVLRTLDANRVHPFAPPEALRQLGRVARLTAKFSALGLGLRDVGDDPDAAFVRQYTIRSHKVGREKEKIFLFEQTQPIERPELVVTLPFTTLPKPSVANPAIVHGMREAYETFKHLPYGRRRVGIGSTMAFAGALIYSGVTVVNEWVAPLSPYLGAMGIGAGLIGTTVMLHGLESNAKPEEKMARQAQQAPPGLLFYPIEGTPVYS